MVPFKRAMVVSYRLSIVTIALSLITIRPKFATECLRRSDQQAVGHFGAKFGEEGVDRCKPNSNTIWERHGDVVCKSNQVDVFGYLSTMYGRDRQTESYRTVTSIAISLSAMSPSKINPLTPSGATWVPL